MSIHTVTRRGLLLGGLAAAAATAGLLGRQNIVQAATGAPRRIVLVLASGGWDVTYALDPKPGSAAVDGPPGTIKDFAGIPILSDPSRPAVDAFFAAHAGITTLINGVNLGTIAHPEGQHRILAGINDDTAPDVAAIASATHGAGMPAPYLVLGRTAFSGPYGSLSARTGSANQIVTLLDPKVAFPVKGAQGFPLIPKPEEEALIRHYVLASAERSRSARPSARVDDFVDSLARGDALREIGQIGELEFARSFDAQVALAVEALGRGLCHSVQLESDGWDTHADNEQQSTLHEGFFAVIKGLVDELTARPGSSAGSKLIDETLVIVASELGRTPRLNAAMGKDHWPVTSMMVIGGGLKGGRVLGGSDDGLGARGVDLESGAVDDGQNNLFYSNLAAGILEAAGVDAAAFLPSAEPFHALLA